MIAAASATHGGPALLTEALALDPSFDPLAAARARDAWRTCRDARSAAVLVARGPGASSACRRSRSPTRSATSRSTTTRGSAIEPDRIPLDVVIDQAEIPAFQARQALDANEDGEVSDAELEAGRVPSCAALTDDLHLAVEGSSMEPDADGRRRRAPPGRRRPVDAAPRVRLRGRPHGTGCVAARASSSPTPRTPGGSAGARSSSKARAWGSRRSRASCATAASRTGSGVPGGSARQRPHRRARRRRGVPGRRRAPAGRRPRRDAGRGRDPPTSASVEGARPWPPSRAASAARSRPSSRRPT